MFATLPYSKPVNGSLEINIKLRDARFGYHSGRCDDDIATLQKKEYIAKQLNPVPYEVLEGILTEYGCEWDDGDDKEELEGIVLWLACGDIIDEARERRLIR
jgi:hypothetical protein